MLDLLSESHPVTLALLAGLGTWALTALGAAVVFVAPRPDRRLLDSALGFTAGVMIAASIWSLLIPAIEMSKGRSGPEWLPAVVGFLLGGVCLRLADRVLPHLHLFAPVAAAEGLHTRWRRSLLLVLAITLHNIPEGLAVGVAFGAASAGYESATLAGAVTLAIGIGLQNLPEGSVISIPLHADGLSRGRAFWYGQLSAAVEPLAAVVGAAVVVVARPLLPYALAFAAGAMIFVVIEEVVPESQSAGNADLATLSAMCGFALMMVLDVALG